MQTETLQYGGGIFHADQLRKHRGIPELL